MPDLIYNIRERNGNDTFKVTVKKWLRKQLIEEKLMNPLGFVFLISASLFIAYVCANYEIKGGTVLFGAIIGIPVIIASLFNVRFGILFMLFLQYFLGIIFRLAPILTWGVVVDAVMCLLVFGIFIKQIGKKDWTFLKNPVSLWLMIWIVYNVIQVANPSATSRLAWVFVVRAMAFTSIFYYVALYCFTSLKYVTLIFKYLVALSLIGALYGCFQEFVVYPQYDLDSFIHDIRSYNLMFQGGKFRKISVFGDPVLFGVIMAFMSIFCVILSRGPFATWKRLTLLVIAFLCAFSMFFSGTRTAFVLIPIGFFFYVMLSHNKKMLQALVVFGFFGTILVFIPTNNSTLYRFQTAFKPSDDASFNVRVVNQTRIRPFIHSHPMGGGLGSTGEFGKRFSPGTYLANFPPDSGFVRIAVEHGWIGLFIYFGLLFVVLKNGIYYYFRCKDPLIKTYYAAVLAVIYILVIASYPQEIITAFPCSGIFCVMIALITRLKDFDPAFAENTKVIT